MTENQKRTIQPTIRGAIRVNLKNSTEVIVAGQEFSVFVTVQNPFEVPLTVRQVRSHIPTEFSDIEQERRLTKSDAIENELYELKNIASDLGMGGEGFFPKKGRSYFPSLSKIRFNLPFMSIEYANPHRGTAIARDLSEETQTVTTSIKIPFLAAMETKKQLKSPKVPKEERDRLVEKLRSEIQQYETALTDAQKEEEIHRILQPGNSVTKVFTFRSSRGLAFNPSIYTLKIEIEYDLGGQTNIDSIEHVIPVKTSISTMMLGSGLGAVAGWFVKNRNSLAFTVPSAIEVAVAIIIGCILIVLFARKKDIQPFIAVEDFWGGVAIGFISAYIGTAFLDSYLPPADQLNEAARQAAGAEGATQP